MPFTPKKKGKTTQKKDEIIGVPEPERISISDIIANNFKAMNRVTFLHRLVYAGEHLFKESEHLSYLFEDIDLQIHNIYSDEKNSGFVLYYPKFFVVMVEGSAYSLSKHMQAILEHRKNFNRMKVLVSISNINQRFSKSFIYFSSVPGILLDKIDPLSDLKTSMMLTTTCVRKMYDLINLYIKNLESEVSEQSYSLRSDSRVTESKTSIAASLMLDPSINVYREYLPEYDLIDFLLSSKYLLDFKTFCDLSLTPLPLAQYTDGVWPCPFTVCSTDIFDIPYNPVCELPVPDKPHPVKMEESFLEQKISEQSNP